ncbi:MAG: hypothetical protein WC119_01525 [Synergistaceae bacterium]
MKGDSEEKFAIVIDDCTQWFTYLIRYEMENEKYIVKENFDVPMRVLKTEFCENIFSRPYDIGTNRGIVIGHLRGFYGWHVGSKDFDRIQKLIQTSKAVDIFELLSKCSA